jgi:hypothetical protein
MQGPQQTHYQATESTPVTLRRLQGAAVSSKAGFSQFLTARVRPGPLPELHSPI